MHKSRRCINPFAAITVKGQLIIDRWGIVKYLRAACGEDPLTVQPAGFWHLMAMRFTSRLVNGTRGQNFPRDISRLVMAFTREVPAGSGRIMRYSQDARRATQFSPGYSMARCRVWKLSPRGPAVDHRIRAACRAENSWRLRPSTQTDLANISSNCTNRILGIDSNARVAN